MFIYNSVKIDTKGIQDKLESGNKISAEQLQIVKDTNYNQMLKDTFLDRVFEAEGMHFKDMTSLHKGMVTQWLLTDLLRETY